MPRPSNSASQQDYRAPGVAGSTSASAMLEHRRQLARLEQAARREPQALEGVLSYWLGSASSQKSNS